MTLIQSINGLYNHIVSVVRGQSGDIADGQEQ